MYYLAKFFELVGLGVIALAFFINYPDPMQYNTLLNDRTNFSIFYNPDNISMVEHWGFAFLVFIAFLSSIKNMQFFCDFYLSYSYFNFDLYLFDLQIFCFGI